MGLPRISYARGKGKIGHNNRDFLSPNIDKERKENNIIIKQESIIDAYEKIFGEAQKNYNDKQKRNDRKINNYFHKLFGDAKLDEISTNNDKQNSFYEWVVGIGDKDTMGYINNPEGAKLAEKAIKIYMYGDKDLNIKSYQERNPNFYVFNAVIHCDEHTPHLHLDVIPFADGYKKGMERQQGIAKALEQMGYGTGRNAINEQRLSEREVFRNICTACGITVAQEEKGRYQTFSPREYKEIKDNLKEKLTPAIKEELTKEVSDLKIKAGEFIKALDTPSIFGKKQVEIAKSIINNKDDILSEANTKLKETEHQSQLFQEEVKTKTKELNDKEESLRKLASDLAQNNEIIKNNYEIFEKSKKDFEYRAPLLIKAEARRQVDKILNNLDLPNETIDEQRRLTLKQLDQDVKKGRSLWLLT